jgi:hypothetical protein
MPIKIQDRDIATFQELAECRFLSLNQIAGLCFKGNKEAARKRLTRLAKVGALNGFRVPGFGRIFSLTSATFLALAKFMEFDPEKPNKIPLATLAHELAVRDFRTSLILGARSNGLPFRIQINSQRLAFCTSRAKVRPDGFFEVQAFQVYRFFFEVDTGTESLSILKERLQNYFLLRRRFRWGKRSERGDQTLYGDFRVLLLFRTERRKKSALRMFARMSFAHICLVATWYEALTDPFGEVWTRVRRDGLKISCRLVSGHPPRSRINLHFSEYRN